MKSDTLKTVAGLFIITIIVVATFMYGNAQRQAQQQNNKQATNASPSTSAKASPEATPTPSAKASATPTPTPSATPKATATPAPTATPTPGTVAGVGAAPATIPDAGPEMVPMLGTGAMALAYVAYRRSRRK